MNDADRSTGSGIGTTLLFLVFLVLKLSHVITWSWWWVTAPLWAVPVFLLAIGGFFLLVALF